MGEAFPHNSCSKGLCAGGRGTGLLVNDLEGAHQRSRDASCHCITSGFTSTAVPHHSCESVNTEDKQLNEELFIKLTRGFQNVFNSAVLLLTTSETALLTCLKVGFGEGA